MKVVKVSEVGRDDRSSDGIFTGGKVELQFLVGSRPMDEGAKEEPLNAMLVNFSPGARTVFHTHDHPQLLYVTHGKGIVATEKEEITVAAGAMVYFPSGENHWHGAAKDSPFSHISITTPGKTKW